MYLQFFWDIIDGDRYVNKLTISKEKRDYKGRLKTNNISSKQCLQSTKIKLQSQVEY